MFFKTASAAPKKLFHQRSRSRFSRSRSPAKLAINQLPLLILESWRQNFFSPCIKITFMIPEYFIGVTLFVSMTYSYDCFSSIQFAQTGEILLLKHASLQIKKLLLHHDIGEIELYTNSFVCSEDACGGDRALSLVDSALLKINVSCRRQLENYHAHFSKVCLLPLLATIYFSADFFGTSRYFSMLIRKAVNKCYIFNSVPIM